MVHLFLLVQKLKCTFAFRCSLSVSHCSFLPSLPSSLPPFPPSFLPSCFYLFIQIVPFTLLSAKLTTVLIMYKNQSFTLHGVQRVLLSLHHNYTLVPRKHCCVCNQSHAESYSEELQKLLSLFFTLFEHISHLSTDP